MRKKIAILGSTGVIGRAALRVARHLQAEIEIIALAARTNIDELFIQAQEFSPKFIAVYDLDQALILQRRLPKIQVLAGIEGLQAISALADVDFVMFAMSGAIGLPPAIAAIESGKTIGIASKEIIVCGGKWLCEMAKIKNAKIFPIDSEHCALHQCLRLGEKQEIRRLILTASGGAFREKNLQDLSQVTLQEALSHPNWQMGPKTMIDCSTLMNKGLEIIEASFLFDVDPKKIETVIHPQSRVHSFVEFIDGALIAQMAEPDMALPIQYAFTYPKRVSGVMAPYDFLKNQMLQFFPPDLQRFPCLKLAMDVLRAGRSYPCFLNAANEVLVDRFLKGQIAFSAIGEKLEKLIASHLPEDMVSLSAILAMDQQARELAKTV